MINYSNRTLYTLEIKLHVYAVTIVIVISSLIERVNTRVYPAVVEMNIDKNVCHVRLEHCTRISNVSVLLTDRRSARHEFFIRYVFTFLSKDIISLKNSL